MGMGKAFMCVAETYVYDLGIADLRAHRSSAEFNPLAESPVTIRIMQSEQIDIGYIYKCRLRYGFRDNSQITHMASTL